MSMKPSAASPAPSCAAFSSVASSGTASPSPAGQPGCRSHPGRRYALRRAACTPLSGAPLSALGLARHGRVRPVVAMVALFGLLGAQMMPGLFTLSAAQAAEQATTAARRRVLEAQKAARLREFKRNLAQPAPAWYAKQKWQEQGRERAMRQAGVRFAQAMTAQSMASRRRAASVGQGTSAGAVSVVNGAPLDATSAAASAALARLATSILHGQAGAYSVLDAKGKRRRRASKVGEILPSAPLYDPYPTVSPKALDVSRDPHPDEIMAAGMDCGALAPTSEPDADKYEQSLSGQREAPVVKAAKVKKFREGNKAFAEAVQTWNSKNFQPAVEMLKKFVREHPDSPWAGEAQLHIADDAQFTGRYSESIQIYNEVMGRTEDAPGAPTFEVHAKARQKWAAVDITLGRFDDAQAKLEEMMQRDPHWRRRTWASYWLRMLSLFRANARELHTCGGTAVLAVLQDMGRGRSVEEKKLATLNPPRNEGFSLAEMASLSKKHGVEMKGFRAGVEQLARLPMPLIIHCDFHASQGVGQSAGVQKCPAVMSPRMSGMAMSGMPMQRMAMSRGGVSGGMKGMSSGRSKAGGKGQASRKALPLKSLSLSASQPLCCTGQSGHGHYFVVESVDAKKGEAHIYNPQVDVRYILPLRDLAREWSGTGLVRVDGQMNAAGLPVVPDSSSTRYVGTRYAGAGSQGAKPAFVPTFAWLTEPEMKRVLGGCYVVQAPGGLGGGGGAGPGPGPPPGAAYQLSLKAIKNCTCSCRGEPGIWANLITFNVFMQDTSMWHDSPVGPDVEITMSYNSQDGSNYNNAFGNKWSFNYGSHLAENSAGVVLVFMPDGEEDAYTPGGSSGYTAPGGVFNTLVKTGPHAFTLTAPGGAKFVYGVPAGSGGQVPLLLQQVDPQGNALTFGYDANIHLTTITDAQGKVWNLSYDAAGHIVKVADSFERQANFTYDANGNMVQSVDMEGHAFQYTYDSMANVTQLNTAQGPWSVGYAGYTANSGLSSVSVLDPMQGQPEIFAFSGVNDVQHYSYTDRRGNVTIYQVGTVITGQGHITSVTAPNGDNTRYDYDFGTGLVTSIQDARGLQTSYGYNAQGQPTTIQQGAYTGNGYQAHGMAINYATNGVDVLSVTNALNQTPVTATYNAYHQVTSLTDALNNTSSITYTAWGAPATLTDVQGHVTTYNYDPNTRLPTSVTLDGVTLGSYTYDNVGRVRTETDSSGLTLTYDYNNLDHVTRVTYPDGTYSSTDYVCCALPGVVTDRSGRKSYYDYDALKRVVRTQDAQGNSIENRYDAESNQVQLVDASGRITRWSYDNLNRPVRKMYADGTYDAYSYTQGLLSAVRSARGITIGYSHDPFENLSGITYPHLPAVSFVRDALDRVTSMTDGLGTTSYSYDVLGRLTSDARPYLNASLSYGYDSLDRASGMTVSNSDGTGSFASSYGYDALGRLSTLSSPAGSWSSGYIGNTGMLQSLSQPNGTQTSYAYDALERLTSVQNRTGAGANISAYAYGFDAAGTPQRDVRTWMESQVGANPLQHVNYGYDAVDQLTSEVSTEQPAPQLSNSYNYDAMGNRTQGQQGGTQGSYTSNKLNQLVSLTSSRTFNGVTSSSTSSYSYDHGGNLSSTSSSANQSGTRYVYDDLDRLSQIVQLDSTGANSHKSEYVYDGYSRKVISREYSWDAANNVWSAPVETRRVYDGMDVVQERDGQNNVTVNYTTEGGIGGLLARTVKGSGGSPDASYFYHYDGSGNVVQLSDATQATVASYSYDSYGNTLSSWGPQSSQPYRYSTKEWDSTNGLYDYGFRFYSPGLGRWINRDPIEEEGGLNLYGFVGNNPVNNADEYGLTFGVDEVLTIGSFALGAKSFHDNRTSGNYLAAGVDLAGMAWDGAALFVPGMPGEAGLAFKGARAGAHAVQAARAARAMRGGAGLIIAGTRAGTSYFARSASSGENPAAASGRQIHESWTPPCGYEKEVRTPSGKRADAVNRRLRHVIELKPNNANAIRKGLRQAQSYAREFQKKYGGNWTYSVQTY